MFDETAVDDWRDTDNAGLRAAPPPLTGDRCQCAACGVFFLADDGFDFHRVGEYAKPGRLKGDRRCLSLSELAERGWAPNELNLVSRVYAGRASPETQGPGGGGRATHLAVGGAVGLPAPIQEAQDDEPICDVCHEPLGDGCACQNSYAREID